MAPPGGTALVTVGRPIPGLGRIPGARGSLRDPPAAFPARRPDEVLEPRHQWDERRGPGRPQGHLAGHDLDVLRAEGGPGSRRRTSDSLTDRRAHGMVTG